MDSRPKALIELKSGKIPREQIVSQAVEMGADREEAERLYLQLMRKKHKLYSRLTFWGAVALAVGLLVSWVGTSSDAYIYFYYWGPIVAGALVCISGVVLKQKLRAVERD